MMATESMMAGRSLRISQHTVHRVDRSPSRDESEATETYIISTLKNFALGVELIKDGALEKTHEVIPLTVTLVYASGKVVEQLGDIPTLTGCDGRGLLSSGCAFFELKVSALSSLRQQQLFRIRVAAPDHPDIAPVYTQPFKTMTKTFRASVRATAPEADAEGAGRDAPAKRNAEAAGLDAPTRQQCLALMALLQSDVEAMKSDVEAMKNDIATLKSQVAVLAPQ